MEPITRRSLLAGACALVAFGSSAIPAAASSAVKKLPDGRVEVRVGAIPALARVGGAVSIGTVKGQPAGLARTGASTYVAFSLRCPHQGAVVQRDASGWFCPAHGSQFQADGALELGPATSRLPRLRAVMSRGRVIVG